MKEFEKIEILSIKNHGFLEKVNITAELLGVYSLMETQLEAFKRKNINSEGTVSETEKKIATLRKTYIYIHNLFNEQEQNFKRAFDLEMLNLKLYHENSELKKEIEKLKQVLNAI